MLRTHHIALTLAILLAAAPTAAVGKDKAPKAAPARELPPIFNTIPLEGDGFGALSGFCVEKETPNEVECRFEQVTLSKPQPEEKVTVSDDMVADKAKLVKMCNGVLEKGAKAIDLADHEKEKGKLWLDFCEKKDFSKAAVQALLDEGARLKDKFNVDVCKVYTHTFSADYRKVNAKKWVRASTAPTGICNKVLSGVLEADDKGLWKFTEIVITSDKDTPLCKGTEYKPVIYSDWGYRRQEFFKPNCQFVSFGF